MNRFENILTHDEITVFTLRALYREYGYSQYKMSKFEEYDLYVRNKDFLVSDNIITFTDTDGKLMALKPDVTLSIIKNSKDKPDSLTKEQYNENVYRISKGTNSFKEFMQVGLECLGAVDDAAITEVLLLAAKSLDAISSENVLEISHLDITHGVLDAAGLNPEAKAKAVDYIGQKNALAIENLCKEEGISSEKSELLKKLIGIYGSPASVLPMLEDFKLNDGMVRAVEQLKGITETLKKLGVEEKLCVDFSLVGDMKYYNGIAMKGFVNGIPSGILSGGQYDNLMKKMGRKSKAIGFAVYLDEIEKFSGECNSL